MKNIRLPIEILPYILLFLFSIFILDAYADEHATPTTFKTPPQLTMTQISNVNDALELLESPAFYDELHRLAKQISPSAIEQTGMFNKTAMLSILGEHRKLLALIRQHENGISYSHYSLDSENKIMLQGRDPRDYTQLLTQILVSKIDSMNNEALLQLTNALSWTVEGALDYMVNLFKQYQGLETMSEQQAMSLVVNSHLYHVLKNVIPPSKKLLITAQNNRYDIIPDTLIKTPDGVELSATIVRLKGDKTKRPTALQFTIYADEASHIRTAIHAAAHGYIGVVTNSRGKRSSSNEITPWEYEGEDATRAIDWISKQPWSNGEVVMYGGSYNGFTQWAAAKHMHPALKAMAPYTAASLITGLPYENNIILTGNYAWSAYVTNNKTVDNSAYSNWQKSNQLVETMFTSGRAITDMDKLDGKPNPWFQKWLKHPAFDEYYQAMVPVKQEYAHINIPVLTVTGYFDGGQISAIDYLTRHYKYNKQADHTLLIGPYNHGTAQGKPGSHHSNYQLDEVALKKDTEEIVFAWFDHVLHGKQKPELLKDKVNYQLMGSNQWRHAESYEQLNKQARTYHLSTTQNADQQYALIAQAETNNSFVAQTVDMADRTIEHNRSPWPVIRDKLDAPNGQVYVTEAFEQPQELAGAITGHFSIAVNKKDVDIGYNFYEIDKHGRAFHLNTYRSRASFAKDMSKRQLLTPNEKTIVPIINARMTAKLIEKGSRLAIVLNVNKNRDAQVNLGSGKPVNDETIADAGEKLTIKWFSDSKINIPLKPWKAK